MDKVKTIADDDQWQLISELGFLQEVLHPFWTVTIRFSTDTFHFLDLTWKMNWLYYRSCLKKLIRCFKFF